MARMYANRTLMGNIALVVFLTFMMMLTFGWVYPASAAIDTDTGTLEGFDKTLDYSVQATTSESDVTFTVSISPLTEAEFGSIIVKFFDDAYGSGDLLGEVPGAVYKDAYQQIGDSAVYGFVYSWVYSFLDAPDYVSLAIYDGGTMLKSIDLDLRTPVPIGGGGGGGGAIPSVVENEEIDASSGGEVVCNDATLIVPADAIEDDTEFSVSELWWTERNEIVPEGLRVALLSKLYEITSEGATQFGDKYITIRIAYDPALVGESESPVIRYFDEELEQWVDLPTTLEYDAQSGKRYAVTRVNHLTVFGVFSTVVKKIELTVGQMGATIDGSPYTLDAAPYIDTATARTLVPIRFVSEALGANVDWLAATRQVVIKDSGKTVVLTIGSSTVLVDNTSVTTDCVPVIGTPGRTFVPLRFVSENLGATVDYISDTKEIIIAK